MKWLAALTIFTGSFMVFGVQPLVGRTLLPEFGGMASVWVTCLAAFQLLLIAGYWYADRTSKGGGKSHLVLLALAAVWLAVVGWRHAAMAQSIAGIGSPAIGTLLAVLALAGVPYVLLSANASLVQMLAGGEYRLYAVSNLGSFAGLLAYPFLLEPWVSVTAQWLLLAGLTVAYAGMLWKLRVESLGLRVEGRGDLSPAESAEVQSGVGGDKRGAESAEGCDGSGASLSTLNPQLTTHNSQLSTLNSKLNPLLWLVLPGVTCFMLNAVTVHLTSAITPVPLMWVYLLSLYLLTYVIGFTDRGSRLMTVWLALGLASAALAVHAISVTGEGNSRFAWNLAGGTGLLLFMVTGLHAWLYRLRPGKEMLTRYYLFLAVGGGIGGALSGLVCPVAFSSAVEYPMAIVVATALAAMALLKRFGRYRAVAFALVAAAGWHVMHQHFRIREHVTMEGRTFYGTWCVSEEEIVNQHGKRYPVYAFTHGGTTHGLQPKDEIYRHEPTSYFGPLGGGLAFSTNPRYAAGKPVRAAVVGLGMGTMAMYGREGDTFRFFEICPEVMKLAEEGPFDYLRECKARREMVLGDARKRLEEEDRRGDERYDIIAIDIFSGDSISMYFVSQEACALYRRRLKDDGTFAMHITNWNIDLMPVMKAAAKAMGMKCDIVEQPPGLFTYQARWAIMYHERPKFPEKTWFFKMDEVKDVELPTDERGSLVPYLMLWQ